MHTSNHQFKRKEAWPQALHTQPKFALSTLFYYRDYKHIGGLPNTTCFFSSHWLLGSTVSQLLMNPAGHARLVHTLYFIACCVPGGFLVTSHHRTASFTWFQTSYMAQRQRIHPWLHQPDYWNKNVASPRSWVSSHTVKTEVKFLASQNCTGNGTLYLILTCQPVSQT